MLKLFGNNSGYDASSQGGHSQALRAIDALYEQEMQANMAALAEQRRKTRRFRSAISLTEYWPFAVGIALSCFAPQISEFVAPFRPWGMWLAFPFAAIAGRPEMNLNGDLATSLPLLFMYAQFPIEGLLARFALKGHVTVPRVAGQILFLHLLAIVELYLVSGPLGK
jgi:hypothetical protein